MSKSKSKPELNAADIRKERWREHCEQRDREELERRLKVIAEFVGQKPDGPMLIPEEDPARDEVKLALAGEVLRLRYQMRLLHSAAEFAVAGRPFGIIPPGPCGK
jgi:hypothetical protein